MTYVDLAMLAVIAVSVIFALYRGFVSSFFSTVLLGLSGLISYASYPLLSHSISANESWMNIFVHFTEGSSHITSMELARSQITSLSAQDIAGALNNAAFPYPFNQYLAQNIENAAYADRGLTTLAQYFDRTLVDVSVNCVSFLLLTFILYFIFTLGITLINAAQPFPMLRAFDWAAAAITGAARGLLLLWLLFMLIPLIFVMLPLDFISEMFSQSAMAGWFFPHNSLFTLIASTA